MPTRAGSRTAMPLPLPMTRAEMGARGWDELDILFVSGDAYVDHPAFGVPLLARLLESRGYRVGIIAQPDWRDPAALTVMGRPRFFAAVSAGAMDSLVNHYTAAKKVRNDDPYTPGGRAGARPNRAVIAYTAALKGAFRGLPVVIGGIEASLRRLAHYDYWDDKVRRSILVDSKADLLVYGMGEAPLLEIVQRAAAGEAPAAMCGIRGTARRATTAPDDALLLPSFPEVSGDRQAYGRAFVLAEGENNPFCARPLAQNHGGTWVVVEPPALPLTTAELDQSYALPFTRRPHPSYREDIPAFNQIRTSLTSHRGCAGGCSFCAIAAHQGKFIQLRSPEGIVAEIDRVAAQPYFHGTISDLGGPTANMYGFHQAAADCRRCRRGSCLNPVPCPNFSGDENELVTLLQVASARPKVRHLFVASGLRFDLLATQPRYFDELLRHHVGGLLKIAPEAIDPTVLRLMRKPGVEAFLSFLRKFQSLGRDEHRRQGIVPYFMSGHPGMTLSSMVDVALFLQKMQLRVEQVQEFTPTPATLSTCIYYTGADPYSGELVYVPRDREERQMQKALLLWHVPENRLLIKRALQRCRRERDGGSLLGEERKSSFGGRSTVKKGRP